MAEAEDYTESIYFRQKMVISDFTSKVNSETVLYWGFSFLFSPLLGKSSQAVLFPAPEDERCAQNDLCPSQIGRTSADITVCIIYLSLSQHISSWHFFNCVRCVVVQTSKAGQEPKPATVLRVKEGNGKGLVSMC